MIEIIKFNFSNIDLRKKAFEIRRIVFVVEQKCPPDLEYENEETSTHFLLTLNGQPVCTSRYRETNHGIKLERFAVLKEHRRKSLGKKILDFMINDLKHKNKLMYLHAQTEVLPFYEKMGFLKIGDEFEEANIMHYKMIYANQ